MKGLLINQESPDSDRDWIRTNFSNEVSLMYGTFHVFIFIDFSHMEFANKLFSLYQPLLWLISQKFQE